MVRPGDGDEWLRCNGAGECLAWSLNDYENFAEPRPQLADTAAAELDAAARLLLSNGWGFRLHATYDETIRADLEVFERIAADGGWPDGTPWLFDHAEMVSQSSLERINSLGGAVGVQHRMAYQGGTFVQRYGSQRAESAPPIKAMLDMGLRVGAGTDAPRVSSYNPWVALSWLVTGQTVGGLQLYPEANRVSRETALDMYTTSGAAFSGESDLKGTISVGKYGDLAVLSADYFSVPDEDISRIESVLTVVGGKIVYSAGDYDDVAAPLPAIPLHWSPVRHFGAYQQAARSGVRQACALQGAAAESEDERHWREQRDDMPIAVSPAARGGCQ
jgi:predicted amidohydrolase YtcJ